MFAFAARKTRNAGFDHKQTDIAPRFAGPRIDQEGFAHRAVGDPLFDAIEDKTVFRSGCSGTHAENIRTGIGLSHCHARNPLVFQNGFVTFRHVSTGKMPAPVKLMRKKKLLGQVAHGYARILLAQGLDGQNSRCDIEFGTAEGFRQSDIH